MNEAIVLPPGTAFGVIAFLLSLLPAGLFLWLWYLRRHDRPVPVGVMSLAFIGGGALVWPAFKLEDLGHQLWQIVSPATAYYFQGAVLPLESPLDILLPAIGTFIIVATVEEGLRYLLLWPWIRFSRHVDQVFDGLVLGVAAGLGFATIENSLYFWSLFQAGNFDTVVFVFFLRFLISTLAHLSFGGLMGALLARGVFHVYRPGPFYLKAFFITWFLHGLYDLLLGVEQSFYAVIMLLPAIAFLFAWTRRRDFYTIQRKAGKLLLVEEAPQSKQAKVLQRFWKRFDSPWNVNAPWMRERRSYQTLLDNVSDDEA
jgi:RsiW-degrading membrane proteinase PrsW (M82 family)